MQLHAVCMCNACLPHVRELVPVFSFRYAFTILSNVGVFSAMFILLEFVHVKPYHAVISNGTTSNVTSTISPSDVWIFSVS